MERIGFVAGVAGAVATFHRLALPVRRPAEGLFNVYPHAIARLGVVPGIGWPLVVNPKANAARPRKRVIA